MTEPLSDDQEMDSARWLLSNYANSPDDVEWAGRYREMLGRHGAGRRILATMVDSCWDQIPEEALLLVDEPPVKGRRRHKILDIANICGAAGLSNHNIIEVCEGLYFMWGLYHDNLFAKHVGSLHIIKNVRKHHPDPHHEPTPQMPLLAQVEAMKFYIMSVSRDEESGQWVVIVSLESPGVDAMGTGETLEAALTQAVLEYQAVPPAPGEESG